VPAASPSPNPIHCCTRVESTTGYHGALLPVGAASVTAVTRACRLGPQDRGGMGELRDTCAAHFDVRLEALVRHAQAQDQDRGG
jgi:hypothetical protein